MPQDRRVVPVNRQDQCAQQRPGPKPADKPPSLLRLALVLPVWIRSHASCSFLEQEGCGSRRRIFHSWGREKSKQTTHVATISQGRPTTPSLPRGSLNRRPPPEIGSGLLPSSNRKSKRVPKIVHRFRMIERWGSGKPNCYFFVDSRDPTPWIRRSLSSKAIGRKKGPSDNSMGPLGSQSLLLSKVATRPVQPDSSLTKHAIRRPNEGFSIGMHGILSPCG